MLLSPRPFGSRSVVRLGVIYPELRPPLVAIPSVRDTAHTFASYGSRERDIYRKLPFRQLHGIHRGQLARSLVTFVPFPHPLPKGLRHVRCFPALRLLCPIWLPAGPRSFVWVSPLLLSTLLNIPCRLSRVHCRGLKAECCRWRVAPCPFHALWLPNLSIG